MPFLQPTLTKLVSGTDLYEPETGGTPVTSVTSGIGISIAGTATAPVVNNTGVLSLTAGTGINLTGTAAQPIVNLSELLGTPSMVSIGTMNGTATGPLGLGATLTNVSYPSGEIPVVAGGVYCLQSAGYSFDANKDGGADYGINLFVSNGANDVSMAVVSTIQFASGGGLFAGVIQPLPGFCFVAAGSTVSIIVQNGAAANAGATTQGSLQNVQLVRIR